ncbi:MAG: FAD-dependent oxidoreductase, partial [Candidatus Hydrogenedentes bacterium]|nr:FAD-dependent oxidoreductase [Candidatus Hydrogenedentota bacterium]
MSSNQSTQVAVLGGGPGGYAAAFMAADLGLEVTLIDVEDNPGGTCLYRGCIPSKALLHVAKVINESRESSHFGLKFGEPEIDLDRVRAATEGVVQQMTGGLGQLVKARKINYLKGRGNFVNSKNLVVTSADGKQIKLAAEYTIIAAGSRPAQFGPLIESERIMNSTGALKLTDIP